MDIEELFSVEAHNAGAEMQVISQDKKPLDMFIVLAGMDSKAWQNSQLALQRKVFTDDGNANIAMVDAMVEITIGWRGFMADGEELEFSKDKCRELYLNAPYIVQQCDTFVSNRANFMQGKPEG